ncbi:MAG: ribosome biogenesis GTP-binding protein YihA/YsxC [Defluviitaleaceae bacterium]|nr:ribosome biogenesis GTP-binding protein YihA/YsxC [Defluviitaleaceae bacterium]
MKINNVTLEAVGVKLEQFPTTGLPEVAFVGRSNVGKSSLINALMGRKSLARVSGSPGKTRTINFYNIEDTLYFVDLPGYGYAKAPKHEKEKWGKMIEGYLQKREQLRAIILLIDIRHPPSPLDMQMYEWLAYYGFKMVFVLTKMDKLKRSQVDKHVKIVRTGLGVGTDSVLIPFSSETKQGREELLDTIERLVQ